MMGVVGRRRADLGSAGRVTPWNTAMVEPMEDNNTQVLNLQRVHALETWLTATNTKLTQVNGQRKYGGPPEVWNGPTPGAHCEVFISQIPVDVYEDLLIPLFSSVGPLWEFRLMMNFSGQNRGFAYAKYSSSGVAADAIHQLHGHMLEPGFRLSVRRSTEKRNLCIGNLPAATRQEELLKVLRVLVEGLDRVSLQTGVGIEGVSATATFSSHYTASMAKKILVEAFKKHLGLTVSVKWQPSMNSDKPLPPLRKPPSLPASPMKRPRHVLSSRPPNVLPPRLARHPSTPPGFCRTVGGPPLLPHLHLSCPSTLSNSCQRWEVSAPAPAMELFEMQYSHTGPDGFLYFTYTVCIPGIGLPFTGLVMILPGPTSSSTLEEARQAAAQQVLQRLSQ